MLPSNPEIEIIAPNLNRRLSGVTSTIVRLVPVQARSVGIVSFGVGLPDFIPQISFARLLKLGSTDLVSGKPRIWHARRNLEMLLGLFLKHILRHSYKLVFTSASQRNHTAYTKFLIRKMDYVIATSAATAKYLEVPNSVILHGIPLEDFSPVEDLTSARLAKKVPGKFVIGCFGRIRKQKGTDVFVDAMIDLLPRHPEASAIIMGRATESHAKFLQELKQKAAANGLADRLLFPGEVPVHKIAEWYKLLSLFVAPQRWEGFGLTPLEAMGCAVPVIATKVGAFPELVCDGKNGKLIEPGHVKQMVDAAEKYINNPRLTLEHGENALAHVHEFFPIEREAEEILKVYKKVQNA
ncbi:MAG: glycosyltransferase family 4 protein [Hyphomicrobiales bacterium]|nr:glycosyltransferase family 4 protein [Hyphomicrobiales bacterium]